jgi:hypothetical protein
MSSPPAGEKKPCRWNDPNPKALRLRRLLRPASLQVLLAKKGPQDVQQLQYLKALSPQVVTAGVKAQALQRQDRGCCASAPPPRS